jgi:hypothetical protein
MAGLTESYCPSNETSHASQFKWRDNTFKLISVLFDPVEQLQDSKTRVEENSLQAKTLENTTFLKVF